MLEVSNLRVASGALTRVDDLNLSLPEHGCVALLGPNGAGKTASVEAIAGLLPKAAGRIIFDSADVTRLTASAIVRRFSTPTGKTGGAPTSDEALKASALARFLAGSSSTFAKLPLVITDRPSAAPVARQSVQATV